MVLHARIGGLPACGTGGGRNAAFAPDTSQATCEHCRRKMEAADRRRRQDSYLRRIGG